MKNLVLLLTNKVRVLIYSKKNRWNSTKFYISTISCKFWNLKHALTNILLHKFPKIEEKKKKKTLNFNTLRVIKLFFLVYNHGIEMCMVKTNLGFDTNVKGKGNRSLTFREWGSHATWHNLQATNPLTQAFLSMTMIGY